MPHLKRLTLARGERFRSERFGPDRLILVHRGSETMVATVVGDVHDPEAWDALVGQLGIRDLGGRDEVRALLTEARAALRGRAA